MKIVKKDDKGFLAAYKRKLKAGSRRSWLYEAIRNLNDDDVLFVTYDELGWTGLDKKKKLSRSSYLYVVGKRYGKKIRTAFTDDGIYIWTEKAE